jgi:hypothetical protein
MVLGWLRLLNRPKSWILHICLIVVAKFLLTMISKKYFEKKINVKNGFN